MGEEKTIQQQIEELRALLVEGLAALNTRIDSIRREFIGPPIPEPPKVEPIGPPIQEAPRSVAEGLFRLTRPGPDEVPVGIGRRMTEANGDELVERARFGVRWNGDVPLMPHDLEAAWRIIERLKVLDPEILPFYNMLDPLFCGVGLLTNIFAPHTSDALSFGNSAEKRAAWAGTTCQSFIELQLAIMGGGGTPSGA